MTLPPPFGRTVPGNRWDLVTADPAPTPTRTVSVVVAHYDQQRQLDRTLTALARQTYPAHLVEIVVADDGSPVPPRVPDGVRLVRQEDAGFRLAAARNLGVRHSTGELLCFLDADTAPEPDYLARLLRLPSALPEAVTVGRRRHADLREAAPQEALADAVARHPLPEPSWLAQAYRGSRDLLDADDRSYRHVIGAVIGCSRWFLEQIGGFDETFLAYGGEDWEWAHRAWAGGAVLAHVPDAVAWHDGPEWAERDEAGARAARAAKNAETLRLTTAIPVAGSRPFAVLTGGTDTRVVLERAHGAAQALVCVDSVLAALPHARVVVPPEVAGVFAADPRVSPAAAIDAPAGATPSPPLVTVHLGEPVRFTDPEVLGRAIAELRDDVATVALGEHVTVRSGRGTLRRGRWGEAAGWRDVARPPDGIVSLPDEPELAAYLGGWG
ncbi:glycosyltransferase [Serinibacter arcticus]|uniref:Glycosyltransferase n=1 Tax=Serinibacter arcticus TaxID=1655435 RepID=A0A4Z1E563_9MICO|nr:glycosyltransferase [Serinibacter arcticus]TGO04877.1 hypothetical protein SERN_2470 [Serinibacter arcticus]